MESERLTQVTREIFESSVQALEKGQAVALATIIQENAGWTIGKKMLVRNDHSLLGDLGDERLTRLVFDIARKALVNGRAQRVAFIDRDGELVEASPFQAGDVEVFIQVLLPSPTLMLIGAGHIGEALVKLAKTLGWRVAVVDDRPEFITAERLPDADDRILARYEPGTEVLAPMPLTITPSTFIVVATWGWDEPALRQIVNSPAAFIGLVASGRKAIIIFRQLIAEGVAHDVLARVRVPIGLDLGGESPAEIALSIMAEILMTQRNATGSPLAQLKGNAVLKLAAQDNRV